MSVTLSDIKFRKSSMISDVASNGNVAGRTLVVSGVRHNLFPRVSKSERMSSTGLTRYRKEFFCNENAANETAYDSLFYFDIPSTSLDRFYLGLGTQADTQADISNIALVGVGALNVDISIGAVSVDIAMESNDFEFIPGGFIHIADKFMIGQAIDNGVVIGDSISYNTTLSKWLKVSQTDDILYPAGVLIGTGKVMTIQGSSNEEWLQIVANQYTENIGTGDGTISPALTALTHATNGIFGSTGSNPVITATCGSIVRTVTIDKNGVCFGYCTAGQLDMATGIFTTPISWTTATDNAIDISVTYHEKPYTYSGDIATVILQDPTVNAYSAASTYVGGCISGGDATTSSDSWSESSTLGTYDEATYPVIGDNQGTVEDSWTLTMTSSTDFSCTGNNTGAISSGTIGSDFIPNNPDTSTPYFTISSAGWAGTWSIGETVTFETHPAKIPLWLKERVDPATPADSNNLFILGFYTE